MEFQGFQNIFPPAVLIIICAVLIALSWYSYKKQQTLPPPSRWILTTLRALTLIIVFLLLMNPYFYSSNEVERKPKVAVFLDNSESTSISKGNYSGLDTYQNLLTELNFENQDEIQVDFYSLGEQVQNFHPDSLTASDTRTNLSDPLRSVLEMDEQVRAAILITDGILTYGQNPSVSAFESSIPLYTIGIGDTLLVEDIAVSNIVTNTTGYTNTNHRIEADITQSGFRGQTITVTLQGEGEILAEQTVSFDADKQVKRVRFDQELEEPGLQQYEIVVNPLPDEFTSMNNRRVFSIDVLDSRVNILHLAFEIHPDVKAIRSVIQTDINNQLTSLTYLGNNRFIEELPQETDFNLVVIHGQPERGFTLPLDINLSETPTVHFTLTNLPNKMNTIPAVKLIEFPVGRVAQVQLEPLLSENEQPILELPNVELQDAPHLNSPLRGQISSPLANPLFGLISEGIVTDYPAIAISEQGNIRRSHVLPWGWYRMLQNPNEIQRNYATRLITNLISWTASDPDNRKLKVNPVKQSFSTAENPELNAILQNERGESEDDAIIEITLQSENSESRTFNMENTGNGNYRLLLPRLSQGLYEYSATARKGSREIETQSGQFLVSNTSMEFINTSRNDELLKSVAQNSGGDYFTYNNATAIWDSLESANIFQPHTETIENYAFPVRNVYWFLLVLFLLGSEWMIRKYYSMP